MTLAAFLALALAALALRLRAAREPDCLAPARLLGALLAADLLRLALASAALAPARLRLGGAPYEGVARLAFHASQALHLAWPFGCAWLAARLWRGPGRLAVAGAWAGASLGLAARYPALRGPALLREYAALSGLAALAGFASALLGERPEGWRPGLAHLASLLLLAGCAAELAGPYLGGEAGAWWWTGQASWVGVLGAVALAAMFWRERWTATGS